MFFLESKHILDAATVDHTLVVNKDGARLQKMMDDVTLCEWIIPILHMDSKDEEVFVDIDETFLKLLKKFNIFSLDNTSAYFDNVAYVYNVGEMVTWETRLPKLAGIMSIPETIDLYYEHSDAHMYIEDEYLNLVFKKIYKIKLKVFKSFQKVSEKVFINFNIVNEIFQKHKTEVCKIYIEEDFPMCLEFSDSVSLLTRYYIAPLYDEEGI